MLEEREALSGARRERKQLPTLLELARIVAGTNPSRWSRPQAEMMRQAARLHGRRLVVFGLSLVLVAATARAWHRRNEEAWRRRTTDSLINRLMVAEIGHVLPVLNELVGTDDLRAERLDVLAGRTAMDAAERLRAEMALVVRDRGRLPALLELVSNADPVTVRVVREWLAARARPAPDVLWSMVAGPGRTSAEKLRFAALLAEFDPDSAERWQTIARDVARAMVADPGRYREAWADLFGPASRSVAPALAEKFLDATATPGLRLSAAQDLAKLGSTELLCRILPDADPAQFSELIRAIKRDPEAAVGPLRAILSRSPPGDRGVDERLRDVARRRNVAASLLLLGYDDVIWPLLESSRDGSLRTELIATMRDYGVPAEALLRGEEAVRDPVARQAIWLALAPYGESLAEGKKAELLHRLSEMWPNASHQSERAAIEWLMRQWGAPDSLPSASPVSRGADWHVNPEGQTFLEVRGPVEFDMGSPADEPQHEGGEVLQRRRIDRSFAISVNKVTAGQFHRYFPGLVLDPKICPTPDCPVVFISWLDAARYCRRLSEEEKIPEDQMCYPRVEEIREDMTFPADFLLRTGYRLPTEAEWEYVCRATTTTRFFFGEDERHLSDYAWWMLNSNERTQPVGRLRPNPFGLFDIVGNSHEWCQDAMDVVPVVGGDSVLAGVPAELRLLRDTTRVLRGANYRSPARNCRSAYRFEYPPEQHYSILGFRIARTLGPAGGGH